MPLAAGVGPPPQPTDEPSSGDRESCQAAYVELPHLPADQRACAALGLTALRTLDLYGSELTSVPADIGNLTALETLNFEGNKLTSVPAALGRLPALQSLARAGPASSTSFGHVYHAYGIIHVIGSCIPCLRSTLWSFTPNDVGDSRPWSLYLGANQLTSVPAVGAYTRPLFGST